MARTEAHIKIATGGGGGGGSVGAKLMKTNQTTSYATGDDGDLQQGRLNSFFILNSNNVFGTNERFTDDIGTQAYSNRIAIDHSTDNGTEILGFFADSTGTNRTWEDSIDWALSVSVGTFTSGWSLPNKRQMYSVINDGAAGHGLNYVPFITIGTLGTGYWSSTTTNNITTYGTMIAANRYSAERVIKTLAVRAYAVRNFTYSDLGVTGAINPIVGADIMKTGQTVSYRTGDDGDLEEGRDVDFLTLPSNNPFGTTARFTDELGGSTYTTGIVIDWSTYDSTNVTGWNKNISALMNWDDAIDNAVLTSIGTYTSGWYLPNINQLMHISKWGDSGRLLDYAPFNFTNNNNRLWSSTTYKLTTTNAFVLWFQMIITQAAKTTATNYRYLPARTFTVTGTTLT